MENDWLIAHGNKHARVRPLAPVEDGKFEIVYIDDVHKNVVINRDQLIHPKNIVRFMEFDPLKHAVKLPDLAMTAGLEPQAKARFKQYCTNSFFNIKNPREVEFGSDSDRGLFKDFVVSDLSFIVHCEVGFPKYELDSLVGMLQRSCAFNGDETRLFHQKLECQIPTTLPKHIPPFNTPISVFAQPTNDIWCEDDHIFVQCSTVESNESQELGEFISKLSEHYKDNGKHVQYRDYKKEWFHEGMLVVVPWLAYSPDELYRGVICGVDVEKQTASISHVDYYSTDTECPLDKVKVLENGGRVSRFKDRKWNSFIVRLPIERFDQLRRDEIRAACTKHIADHTVEYDPLPIDIIIHEMDKGKVNVFIGDIVTRRDDTNNHHATICNPEEITVVAEEPAPGENLTVLDEKIPDLETVPICDPVTIQSEVSEQLEDAIADEENVSEDVAELLTPVSEPVNSYDINPPTPADIRPDSGSVSSEDSDDDYSPDNAAESTTDEDEPEKPEQQPENTFRWTIMNGGVEQFKCLIQNDEKDLIGEICHVKNGKIIFHATHSSTFAKLDTTVNHKTSNATIFNGPIPSGDWIIENTQGEQYRARIVVETEQKINLYRFDASSTAEIFGSGLEVRLTYPKFFYPVEHDACFTFALCITDEFDLAPEPLANVDECLPLTIKQVEHFKVNLLDRPSKIMDVESINKVIYPDQFEVLPAMVTPYLPHALNGYYTDLKTVLEADCLYGDMNRAWEKVGNDFDIPLHSSEYWPTLAIPTRDECKKSIQSGHLTLPIDPFCFGIRLDDLKHTIDPVGENFAPEKEILIHGAKFVLHAANGKYTRCYIDTYQSKATLVDIDTGVSKNVEMDEILVFPKNTPKVTTTILCALPLLQGSVDPVARFGHMLQVDGEPISKVNFQIVGYDEYYARYYVDLAYRTTSDAPYKSYVDHLVEKKLAKRVEGVKKINLDEFNAKVEEEAKAQQVKDDSTTEQPSPSDMSSVSQSTVRNVLNFLDDFFIDIGDNYSGVRTTHQARIFAKFRRNVA